jgi:hypothetical protein
LFFRHTRPGTSGRWCRLQLEGLEERTLLNTRFVVPVGAADNVSSFATLSAALTTPGLHSGDTIQIEPGSAPGTIGNANLPAVTNLTIRGDASTAAVNLPAFQVRDAVTIDASRAGFTLANINVVLQGGGLTFSANGSIIGSFIASNFLGDAITFNGVTASVLRDSQVIARNGLGGGEVVRVNTADSSHNLISDNTIASDGTVSQNLLFYNGTHTVADQVLDNTFQGNTGASSFSLLLVGNGVSGLTVRGNSFSDPNNNRTAITILSGGQNNTIADNTITMTGASGTIGISLLAASTSTATAVTIADNRINTSGNGTGIQFTTSTGALNARVEGNDFHFNNIGVLIYRSHTTDIASGIDMGGGSQGSRGANNFRSFFATTRLGTAAIMEGASFSTAQTIEARFNLFSVANPRTVIRDNYNVGGAAAIDVSGNLTGNAAFIETLYLKYLHRVVDVSATGEAGGWVASLNGGAPRSAIASAIMNSPEALGIVVNGLYRRFLNREPGAAETGVFVSLLQNGATLEQVMGLFLNSPEFQSRFSSDSAFIQAIYSTVLGRTAGTSEVNLWAALLPSIGRSGMISDVLGSMEYRAMVIQQDYATVLGRLSLPSMAEVMGWVNTGLDLRSFEMALAGSAEFFANA